MKRLIFFQVSLLVFLSVLCTTAQTIIPTEIPVSYDVGNTGAFTYSVPLEIPPGINGLIPNLAISYSNQSNNSNMGYGWTLTGISSISRSNTTIYHQRILKPVNFDGSDVFMMDGQRLFETSPQTYMTEIKNFAVIQSHGTAGNGPSYFTVEYPNGLTYEFGNSADSKMLAQGRSDVLTWAVNKISDRSGNIVTFTYYNNPNSAQYRVTGIFYGVNANAAVQQPNWIKMNYIPRPDINTNWIGAASGASPSISDSVVISNIEIRSGDSSVLNTYQFTYDFNSDYTHLVQIDEKRGLNNHLPPIKLNWGAPGTDYFAASKSQKTQTLYYYTVGDFNGDGATDFGRVSQLGSVNSMEAWQSDKHGDFIQKSNNIGLAFAPTGRYNNIGAAADGTRVSLDYNGDGLDDIIVIENDLVQPWEGHIRIHLYQSNGETFDYKGVILAYDNNSWCGSACIYTSDRYLKYTRVIPGDYDGDGKKDLMVLIPSDLTGTDYIQHQLHPDEGNEGQKFDCFIVGDVYKGGGFLSNLGSWGQIDSGQYRYVGKIEHEIYGATSLEYDGDGKTELLTVGNGQAGHDAEIWQLSPTYTKDSVLSPGALSVIYYDSYPSHETRIKTPNGWPDAGQYRTNIYPGDFNGDGKDDLLTWKTSGGSGTTGTWEIAYSTGLTNAGSGGWILSSTALPVQSGELYDKGPWYNGAWAYQIADFNGDGKADILQMHDGNNGNQPFNASYSMFYSLGTDRFVKDSALLPDSFYVNANDQFLGDYDGDGQMDILSDFTNAASPTVAHFRKNDQRNMVTSIEHAGKRIDIEYKTISAATPDTADEDHYGYNDWHIDDSVTIHTPREYPYMSRQLPLKVVTKLNDNISLAKSYYYQTLSINLVGLGMQGFEKIKISDFTSQKLTIAHNSLFPWWGFKGGYSCIPFLYETTVAPLYYPNEIMFHKRYNYTDVPADTSGNVRIIISHDKTETDYVSGKYINTYQSFDFNSQIFKDFGKPEWEFTDFSVQDGYQRDSSIYTYGNGLPFYNASKPVSVRRTMTYPNKDPYTRTTDFLYNTQGLLAKEVGDPGTLHESTTDFFYDTFGNPDSTSLHSTGLLTINKSMAYSKDGRFQITAKSFADGYIYVDSFSYNQWGKVTMHQEASGLKTFYKYDSVNRLISTIRPDDVEEVTTYDWAYNDPYGDNPNPVFSNYNNITSNQSAAQFVTMTGYAGWADYQVKYYDFNGHLLRSVIPSFNNNTGNTSIYEDSKYFPDGKLMETSRPYYKGSSPLEKTTYQYDKFDREIQKSGILAPTVNTEYYPSVLPGYLRTVVTNHNTMQTKTSYSNIHESYWIEDNGVPITYTYNSNGQPDEIVVNNDPLLSTRFRYDDYGRVRNKTEPNKGVTRYTYNAYDQVLTEEDDNLNKFTYTYDALGRTLSKTDQNGKGFFYDYYKVPGLSSTGKIKDKTTNYTPNGNTVTTHYDYNSTGKTEKVIETVDAQHSYTTEYTYGALGRIATIKYPSNIVVAYQYSPIGQLFRVWLDGNAIWELTEKNELGQTVGANYLDQNGQALYTAERLYDQLGYPMERKVSLISSPFSTPIYWEGYSFDANTGNLDSREDKINNLSEFLHYDEFDRLTDVTPSASYPSTHIEYDHVGNITKKNDVTASIYDWQYNQYALHTVPDATVGTNPVPLSSARQPNDQDATFYPFGKIKQLTEAGNTINFVYNADQERVKMTFDPAVPNTKEKYYASNYEEIVENGSTTKISYITAAGEPIAMVYTKNNISKTYFLTTDYLGSIKQVLDNTGNANNGIVEERSYDAWGRVRDPLTWKHFPASLAPTWLFDRGYTGQEHIWMTGSYDHSVINMNGRLYDPLVGRMFSPDPVVADNTSSQAFNKYSYVLNNPFKYKDPSGNVPFLFFLVIYSACMNLAANAHNVETGKGDIASYLEAGAIGTLAGYEAGVFAANLAGGSGFWAGAAAGSAGGFTGDFALGASNTIISGGSFGDAMRVGLTGGASSAIMGGLLSGLYSGFNAKANDRDFWTGDRTMAFYAGLDLTGNPVCDIHKAHQYELEKFLERVGLSNWNQGELEGCTMEVSYKLSKRKGGETTPYSNDWSVPGKARIKINNNRFSSDIELYRTIDHELFHAHQIVSGIAAKYFNKYYNGVDNYDFAKSQMLNMTEVDAWNHTMETDIYNHWNGQVPIDKKNIGHYLQEIK